ncbi:CsiV family protein [Ferrimonas balearica]|uniref:CsiV family protein n=1 Tax=Ferrimonas balearica TaxID=44012 RepID=UPI001C99E696|nr:CsiV family protein [Ferrimonas balearica]MBY5993861.1 peptidoglycan binding protein CsiV [Ferrimonas balearica]
MKPLMPLLALLSALTAAPARSEDPTWFEVEVLVFSRPDNSGEIWDADRRPVKLGNSRDLLGPVMMPDLSQFQAALAECDASEWLLDPQGCESRQQLTPSFPDRLPVQAAAETAGDPLAGDPFLLTAEQLEFGDARRQIGAKGGHQILLHTGWQMPVYGRRQAQPFHLYGGRNFGERFDAEGHLHPPEDDLLSQFDFFTGFSPSSGAQADPVWELNGWLRIYLDHFLFIETRLDLRQEGKRVWKTESLEQDPDALTADVAVEEEAEPFLLTIPLEQNRRVRSREIHYFDHPQLGLVVQIRRMTQPEAVAPEAEVTPQATLNP